MKKLLTVLFLVTGFIGFAQQKSIDQRVDELMKKMTLEEKIGQLNQYTGDNTVTGPLTINPNKQQEIKRENLNGWKETDKDEAVNMIENLLSMIRR